MSHRFFPTFHVSYLKEPPKDEGLELRSGPWLGFRGLVARFLDDYPIGSGSPDHMCGIDPESMRAVNHLA